MSLCFTTSWDDGHPLDQRLADLLSRHGCAGTFYVPMRNREGLPVMAAAALRALDAGFEIGSHTLDHVYADRVSAAAWAQQVKAGRRALEDQLGHAVAGFCYPGGRLDQQSVAAVKAAGFSHARTVRNLHLGAGRDRFRLPTTLQIYPHSRAVLLRNWLRGPQRLARWPIARAALSRNDWQRRCLALLQLACETDQPCHFWGHAWEIEARGLWSALDEVLRQAAALVPAAQRWTNAQLAASLPADAVQRGQVA